LADLYFERGEYAKALENYQKSLTGEPNDFSSIVQAGNSARHAGDDKAAAALFTRAAELRPDSWIPVYNQACLAASEGDPARALGLLSTLRGKTFVRPGLLEQDHDLAAVRRLPGYPPLVAELEAKVAADRQRLRDRRESEDDTDEDAVAGNG
jgi:Flp pilus assembly protein TadD